MTINISLSTESIRKAIRKLEQVKENLEIGLTETIDILTQEGAEIAQAADGSMATVTGHMEGETKGVITAGGEAPIIAEFGAGYATMEFHPFAKQAPVDVKVGSYSEQNDGMFYWSDYANPGEGYWFFGGMEFDRIQPRHGLLNAHDHIMEISTETAQEVIKL